MLAEPGTYHLNAWPQSGDTGGFFLNGFTLTTDTVFNIILTPRAIFSEIELSPHSIRQGDVVSASFSITDENNVPLSGIPDSTYTIWLHNWQEDPSDNWWENPISNQYHQDISEVVNVVENEAGSYTFSFIIPSDMVVTSGWLDLEIRLGESGGMAGIQVALENSVVLSGIVVAEDGSVLPRAGVGLVDEVNNKEFFIETDSSGRYTLFVEPGVYTLMAKGGEDLSGYRRIGFSITSDTTWDIVLVQRIHMNIVESVPEPFNSTDTFTISLEVFDDSESLITGLLNSEFNIWIHNHNDPEDWRSNPIQNNYHQDLTNIITVTEISPGRYSFTFTIPDGIDIDQNMMSLNIHLVKYGGWVSQTETGLPIN